MECQNTPAEATGWAPLSKHTLFHVYYDPTDYEDPVGSTVWFLMFRSDGACKHRHGFYLYPMGPSKLPEANCRVNAKKKTPSENFWLVEWTMDSWRCYLSDDRVRGGGELVGHPFPDDPPLVEEH